MRGSGRGPAGPSKDGFLSSVWREHSRSYLRHVLVSEVQPKTVLPVVAGASALLLAMYLIPQVRRFTGFDSPWIPITLIVLGGLVTLLQWRFWRRQTVVQALCLVDNCLYCLAVIAVMLDTTSPVCYVWGLLYGQMAAYYGKRYAFSWPHVLSISVIPMAVTVYFGPADWDWGLLALTLFGALIFMVSSTTTRHARRVEEQKKRYQEAYELTDKVATESLDIALAASMAEIGNFLHEMRNASTPVVGDLMILKEHQDLHPEIRESVESLERCNARTSELMEKLLASIKGRAAPRESAFLLSDVLSAERLGSGLMPDRRSRIALNGQVPEFEITGNPEHLKAAVDNLVQNACNAGARRIEISASLDGGLKRVLVNVSDDGPGIPGELRNDLFGCEGAGSHGLGLPLSKRLVEVLGGELRLASTGDSGTSFEIAVAGRCMAVR